MLGGDGGDGPTRCPGDLTLSCPDHSGRSGGQVPGRLGDLLCARPSAPGCSFAFSSSPLFEVLCVCDDFIEDYTSTAILAGTDAPFLLPQTVGFVLGCKDFRVNLYIKCFLTVLRKISRPAIKPPE